MWEGCGHETLLNFAGGAKFSCCAGLLAADTGEAEEHHYRYGEQKEEIAKVVRLNGKGANRDGIIEKLEALPAEEKS